ncbi:hypothetical protein K438DRAFT_1956281 [Mycena galopus ATCC 62051]|nr:hypothetical protein K438DRAFT_1956281 [Mycena galopus ATCC 62051]
MDSLHFSTSSHSNSSNEDAPRTPSPPTMPARYPSSSPHQNYKHAGAELDPVRIFSQDDDQPYASHWGTAQASSQFAPPASRPSLLQELYEQEPPMGSPEHASPPDMYVEPTEWPAPQQQPRGPPQDYTLIRRATFPYARQERPEDMAAYPPFLYNPSDAHGMPLSAEPSALHGDARDSYSFDPQVKVEHAQQQQQYHPPPSQHFYRTHQHHPHPAHLQHPHAHHPYAHPSPYAAHGHPHMLHGYPAPHGIAVQHTDDAASKETQYLRRRCFNCHTTEPPSWRRSTLNPGKIVCNKCGLYERTHLRARPLRFDELRAGNKARKGGKGVGSPKQQTNGGVKKQTGGAMARRSSVSSTGSSAQSGSGASDWDDNVSVYSNGSAPPTSFNSPSIPTAGFSPVPPSLSLSSSHSSSSHGSPGRDSLSRSPPLLNGPLHSPPGSASSYNGQFAHGSPHLSPHMSPHIGSPHLNGGGNGIRLPHAPEIPTLVRTKPRSNTTGGLHHSSAHSHNSHNSHYGASGMYYSPPAPAHSHSLHHSGSNSSLHAEMEQQQQGQGGPELYRRGSLPDFHGAGVGVGVGLGGTWEEQDDGMRVKEEPRSVLV